MIEDHLQEAEGLLVYVQDNEGVVTAALAAIDRARAALAVRPPSEGWLFVVDWRAGSWVESSCSDGFVASAGVRVSSRTLVAEFATRAAADWFGAGLREWRGKHACGLSDASRASRCRAALVDLRRAALARDRAAIALSVQNPEPQPQGRES